MSEARSASDEHVSVARLVLRFVAAGVVVLVALALAIALTARSDAIDQATDEARQIASISAKGTIEPLLTDALIRGEPAAIVRMNRAVQRSVLLGSLVRLKVWVNPGRIVYSDESRLIGRSFDLEPDERSIMVDGGNEAEISDLDRPENNYERSFGKLLEVYVGGQSRSGEPVLIESYFRYNAIQETAWTSWQRFAPLSLGALVILELVQIPFAISLARRLQRNQQQRERLLMHAVAASDAERRRVAGDLHDGVVQELTGITYTLDAGRLAGANNTDSTALIADSASRLRGAIGSLRTLLVDIYPPNLAEVGLESALNELADGLERHGLRVIRTHDAAADPDPRAAGLLFRVAQEALRNIVSHSGATTVEIALHRAGTNWQLSIDDDGTGFDADALTTRRHHGHFGLQSLADLVADAGGSLRVRSATSKGTRVEVEVPAT